MPTLKNGELIPILDSNEKARILNYIAEGGQGEVYRVLFNNKEYALKWYSKIPMSDAFYNNLAHNVKMGKPNDNFLWAVALTQKIKNKFGYIMPLRPSNYKEYGEFLLGDVRFGSWDMLFKAALNLAESFRILHSRGYSYQDLNEGSFFIDPDTGNVLICDNDNVAPYGVNLGVKGMPKYMAPEVVLDKSRPNTHTDRFSLAVILFRLFYIDHPLEGQYTIKFPLTDQVGAKLFGEDPVFVYDPQNNINRPDPNAHPNVISRWNMFPPDLNAAFTKAFTDGLKDIDSRITELQWIEVLVRARGMLVKINGREQFVNAYHPETLPKECRILRTEENIIALAPDSVLYQCQTDKFSEDYSTPSGLVRASQRDKNVYGLGNLTNNTWTLIIPDKEPVSIQPKGFVPLIPGIIIDFGNIKAKVF